MAAPRLKGSVLRTRLAFVEQHAGPDALARVLARLPADQATSLRSILSANWYPFELGTQLDRAVVDELGGGRPEFFLRLGAESADRNLGGVHKVFIKSDPHLFLSQAPTIYSLYYDRCNRTYERTAEREIVVSTAPIRMSANGSIEPAKRSTARCGPASVMAALVEISPRDVKVGEAALLALSRN